MSITTRIKNVFFFLIYYYTFKLIFPSRETGQNRHFSLEIICTYVIRQLRSCARDTPPHRNISLKSRSGRPVLLLVTPRNSFENKTICVFKTKKKKISDYQNIYHLVISEIITSRLRFVNIYTDRP